MGSAVGAQRGAAARPYLIPAGLEESVGGEPRTLRGSFVNLFNPELRVQSSVTLTPGSRYFLLDLGRAGRKAPRVLASACKALPTKSPEGMVAFTVEGVPSTDAVVLLNSPSAPKAIRLGGELLTNTEFSESEKLLWVRFPNAAIPRELVLEF